MPGHLPRQPLPFQELLGMSLKVTRLLAAQRSRLDYAGLTLTHLCLMARGTCHRILGCSPRQTSSHSSSVFRGIACLPSLPTALMVTTASPSVDPKRSHFTSAPNSHW